MTPTREEVIRVARECGGLMFGGEPPIDCLFTPEILERLAQHFYEAGAAAAFVKCLELADDCADADMHASMAANAIRPHAKAKGEKT